MAALPPPQDDHDDADTICIVAIARRLFGLDEAEALMRDLGGTTVAVPARIHPDHLISLSIGYDKAQVLTAECFGVKVYVPSGTTRIEARRAQLLQLLAKGLTTPQAARSLSVSDRTIQRDLCALRSRGIPVVYGHHHAARVSASITNRKNPL